MTLARWSASLLALAALLALSPTAEAQSVVVQGQVNVDPYGQPTGTPQPPPGYGVQGQVYVQPQYPQQQYVQPQYQQPYYGPQYQQPAPQVRYEDRQESIRGLWVTGIIAFGVGYVVGGVFGLFSGDGSFSDWMWAPVIGPWVALGFADSEDEVALSVISGLLQTAGLTMFILGLSLQRTVRVAVYGLDESDDRSPSLALDLLPAPGGAQLGLTLSHF